MVLRFVLVGEDVTCWTLWDGLNPGVNTYSLMQACTVFPQPKTPGRTQPEEGTPCGVKLFLKHEQNTLYLFKFRAISFHISLLARISAIKWEASQTLFGGPCLVGVLVESLLMSSLDLFEVEQLNQRRSGRFSYPYINWYSCRLLVWIIKVFTNKMTELVFLKNYIILWNPRRAAERTIAV